MRAISVTYSLEYTLNHPRSTYFFDMTFNEICALEGDEETVRAALVQALSEGLVDVTVNIKEQDLPDEVALNINQD